MYRRGQLASAAVLALLLAALVGCGVSHTAIVRTPTCLLSGTERSSSGSLRLSLDDGKPIGQIRQ
jgi:hypothetical protein